MDWITFREPVSTWTHFLWLLLAIPGTAVLLWRGRACPLKQLGFLVYGLGLTSCYAASTLYHAVQLSRESIDLFATLDYIGIYLLIAGTVTPPALVLLRRLWRRSMLLMVWGLAAVGISLRLVPLNLPSSAWTGLYLGMGWGAVMCYFELARVLSHRALLSVLVGGLLYSAGAVLYICRWPVLYPGVFGAHEFFHLLVMGGTLAHFWFMLTIVAPFEPALEVVQAEAVTAPSFPRPQRLSTSPAEA